MTDDWTVQVFSPRDAPGIAPSGGEIVEASVDALRESWHDTVEKLTAVVDGIDDDISTWGVSQVEVGLTLSAKGRLLFIAQAGAEASVKITLTRRQP
ncbi:hypothetical protein [uncultured Microbacterium sp.]|uniref:Pepco domain-containing protein n=1 Tax=uncultured Microbacterium sp. TaxID=191216 RepID=UPI0025F604B2|nr:hypothetical protein [uncultured Microbacterium sp.]